MLTRAGDTSLSLSARYDWIPSLVGVGSFSRYRPARYLYMWIVLSEYLSALSFASHMGMPSAGVWSPGAWVMATVMPSLPANCLISEAMVSWLCGESWYSAPMVGEYPEVRHCLGLIATNLLARGVVAYSRRGNFYSENRTRHYTRANMMRAVSLAEKKGYAVNVIGFKSERYARGIASNLTATEGLRREFKLIRRLELDVELLPLLVIDGKPVFAIGASDAIDNITSKGQGAPATGVLDPPTTYDVTYKLNRGYFNQMRIGYGSWGLRATIWRSWG